MRIHELRGGGGARYDVTGAGGNDVMRREVMTVQDMTPCGGVILTSQDMMSRGVKK